MKYADLIWRNLMRKKARTLFTFLSITVAFLLFAYLAAIKLAFGMGIEMAGDDRLIMLHKVSMIQPLPLAYQERMRMVPGVTDVAHASWFGGSYRDEENRFPIFPVDPESFLRLFPEFKLPAEQKAAWIADRTGAVVGRTTMERMGWKLGDRIPIRGTIYRRADGSDTWEFTIRGVYEGEQGVDQTIFLVQYEFFNEARAFGKDLVGWYYVRIDDPAHAASVAAALDERFANSEYETETMPEKAFVQSFAKQVGNVGAILRAVLAAVFFTILLVAGNTMAQSVRERVGELAVLKTLGFTDRKVLALVLAESLLLAALAGGLGLALGWLAVEKGGDPTGGRLAVFYFPGRDIVLGVVVALGLGLASGLFPALRAMRLRIVDALRSA